MNNGEVVIRVIDLSGNIILTENLTINGGIPVYRMDLSSLTKGIYFIRMKSNSGVRTEKLILQ